MTLFIDLQELFLNQYYLNPGVPPTLQLEQSNDAVYRFIKQILTNNPQTAIVFLARVTVSETLYFRKYLPNNQHTNLINFHTLFTASKTLIENLIKLMSAPMGVAANISIATSILQDDGEVALANIHPSPRKEFKFKNDDIIITSNSRLPFSFFNEHQTVKPRPIELDAAGTIPQPIFHKSISALSTHLEQPNNKVTMLVDIDGTVLNFEASIANNQTVLHDSVSDWLTQLGTKIKEEKLDHQISLYLYTARLKVSVDARKYAIPKEHCVSATQILNKVKKDNLGWPTIEGVIYSETYRYDTFKGSFLKEKPYLKDNNDKLYHRDYLTLLNSVQKDLQNPNATVILMDDELDNRDNFILALRNCSKAKLAHIPVLKESDFTTIFERFFKDSPEESDSKRKKPSCCNAKAVEENNTQARHTKIRPYGLKLA
jgi:hypothetical protein